MRVILTGAAGFIGGHAYDHFVACNDDVLVIDKMTYASDPDAVNRISQLEEIDICDSGKVNDVFERYKPDVVVNFAAETHVDNSIASSRDFVLTNVLGSTTVMDACIRNNVKLCHVSTDEVYGPADDRPFVETDRLSPMNPYSVTKAAADMMVKAYRNTHKLDYIIVRPSNNYGPRQHHEKMIPKLLECMRTGQKFPVYGEGLQIREWTYVKDTARQIRQVILSEKEWESTYHISSGISKTNLETIASTLEAYNQVNKTFLTVQDVIEFVADRKGHDKRYWISTEKSEKHLGRIKYTSFEDGIRETVAEYIFHSST